MLAGYKEEISNAENDGGEIKESKKTHLELEAYSTHLFMLSVACLYAA